MDDYERVITALGRLIRKARLALDNECTTPREGPDQSDGFITNERQRVKALCELRDRFEDVGTSSSTPRP